ncbi:GNAT family N-acetyltransferase [Rhodovibrionaceae bacterium A322]
MPYLIRQARQEDLPSLLELYRDLHDNDVPLSGARAQQVFDGILSAPHLQLFVLDQAGQISASCYLNILPNLTRGARPYGVIENVVTHHNARRLGLGKAVVQHALAAAWQAGCYKVMLMTGRPEMVPFYEACGFTAGDKTALIARAP